MMSNLKSKKFLLPIAVVLIMLGGSLLAYFVFIGNGGEENPQQQWFSKLTGEEVTEEEAIRPVLGVIIENTPQARPLTGLDAAGIVFEAQTEAGITRYLAFYQADLPEIVGPIRSLRPHFVHWTRGFDVSIAHVGGSKEALEMVEKTNVKDLDQFKYPDSYFRDNTKTAPHNMYARVSELFALIKELNYNQNQFTQIPRSNDTPTEQPGAKNIEINYSTSEYRVEFRYNIETNSYTRYLAGNPHVDEATGKPITVKNIILLRVGNQKTGVDAIGSGEALVFKDGMATDGRWEKPESDKRIRIIDEQGNEVPLNRGNTWFTVVPGNREVNY